MMPHFLIFTGKWEGQHTLLVTWAGAQAQAQKTLSSLPSLTYQTEQGTHTFSCIKYFLCSECSTSSAWPLFDRIPHMHTAFSRFSPTLTTHGIGGPPAKQTRAPLRWVFLPESAFLETEEWHLLLHCSTPKDASDTWPWVQDNLLLAVHHLGH